MGKQFFIDEIYNVMSLIATLSNNVFVNGTGDEVKKYISFKNMFVYSKQSLKINIDKESPYIKSRIEILNKRIPISKEPQKIISKIQELEGKVFKANLNNEDIFKYKGIKEKVYSICHFFKALHECELCYSQELMIPKIYNFLEQRYNNTHSIGFYIMKQGFYNVLVNLFKDKGCNLSLILENAKKETDLGFKLNNELVNFFDQLNLVPIDYYIKSLIIVNSSLKDLSRTRYIIA